MSRILSAAIVGLLCCLATCTTAPSDIAAMRNARASLSNDGGGSGGGGGSIARATK
jgi:hypothetical protein